MMINDDNAADNDDDDEDGLENNDRYNTNISSNNSNNDDNIDNKADRKKIQVTLAIKNRTATSSSSVTPNRLRHRERRCPRVLLSAGTWRPFYGGGRGGGAALGQGQRVGRGLTGVCVSTQVYMFVYECIYVCVYFLCVRESIKKECVILSFGFIRT